MSELKKSSPQATLLLDWVIRRGTDDIAFSRLPLPHEKKIWKKNDSQVLNYGIRFLFHKISGARTNFYNENKERGTDIF